MHAHIITIGDELLIGQVIDTNSAWIAQQLNLNGIQVSKVIRIPDDKAVIINTIKSSFDTAEVLILTGGLGPTKDDLTKDALCEYYNTGLVFNNDAYEDIVAIFKKYEKEVTPLNRTQAEVPSNCKIIRNKNGTAPGMLFNELGKTLFSLPGVPYEMKAMIDESVIPYLKKEYKLPEIVHKTVLTIGIGESFLSDMLEAWEASLKNDNIKLAYLPAAGRVRLRLSAIGKNKSELNQKIDNHIAALNKIIPDYIYGYEKYGESQPTPAEITGKILFQLGKTLSLAESCTGGYLSHCITLVPGSSNYFKGAVISYSNEIKINELGIPAAVIENNGAVSKETAEAMATGIRSKYNTDYALAITGIAGPDGGTVLKPVGTVWIALADAAGVSSELFHMGSNRSRNIEKSANQALEMLRKKLVMNLNK